MRIVIFSIAVAAAAAANAASTFTAGALKFSSKLLEWSVSWPAEVSAIPALLASIRNPAIANKRELLKTAAADKAERTKHGFPFFAYDSSVEVKVAGNTQRLLSLTDSASEFTGGAHPNSGLTAILWDRRLVRAINFDGLFTGSTSGFAAVLRKPYCAALTKERAKRRGPDTLAAMSPTDDPFNQCPQFSELALIPTGHTGKPFDSVTIHADPYVAGPYSEGYYDIALPVAATLVAALKPEYRSSFEPQPQRQ